MRSRRSRWSSGSSMSSVSTQPFAGVDVPDLETAETHRFLGSPTIRVNGRDVEPGAEERSEFVISCRVYRTDGSFKGEPDERWLRDALITAS